jgi:uncharacterized protein (TIGR03435 family)
MIERVGREIIMLVVAMVAGGLMVGAVAASGQTAASAVRQAAAAGAAADGVSFAVSVIKRSGPESGQGLSVKFLPGGRFVARNANVRLLIKIAYNLNDDEVSGGPSWIGLRKFDIDATTDPPLPSDGNGDADHARNHLLLQGLLRDRFHLRLRKEMKEMQTFGLVVAKNGPKVSKSTAVEGAVRFRGGVGTITAVGASMDQLAAGLEDWVRHPVENLTGLDGKYDFKLEWTPDQAPTGNDTTPPDTGPTIFTALHQQLGLSLEGRRIQAPCEFVESVEVPSEN